MSTIEETVNNALRARGLDSYSQYARPVIEVLQDREREITTSLIAFAEERDVDPDDVRVMLAQTGLTMPSEPEPEVQQQEGADGTAAILSRIEQTLTQTVARLDGLESVARRRGLL